MSNRIGLSMDALRRIDPAACATDSRLVYRNGDDFNMAVWQHDQLVNLPCRTIRDLRLLAAQLNIFADSIERDGSHWEVVA